MDDKINLADKLAQFSDHWVPRTIARLNDYDVMVVKVRGDFVWHTHDETDDFFLVLDGRLTVRLRDRDVTLGPGDLFVVPRGVEHQTVAVEEAQLLLIEPTGTPNTGDAGTAAPPPGTLSVEPARPESFSGPGRSFTIRAMFRSRSGAQSARCPGRCVGHTAGGEGDARVYPGGPGTADRISTRGPMSASAAMRPPAR
jgi:mannose-6-phosphate isomerase-like protein (cupin superfamily)